MLKTLLIILSFTNLAIAGSLDGKNIKFLVEVKGLAQTNETLTAKVNYLEGVLGNGFFYGPANKEMKIAIPKSCESLVQLAFSQNVKLKIEGEVGKHEEYLTHPTTLDFNENKNFRCEILKQTK